VVANPGGASDSRAARRLNEPRAAAVTVGEDVPAAVARVPVARVREEWRVVERWWTGRPVRRRYFDLVLETGENVVVFRDESSGDWFRQRA
jgi:hypothetical protein